MALDSITDKCKLVSRRPASFTMDDRGARFRESVLRPPELTLMGRILDDIINTFFRSFTFDPSPTHQPQLHSRSPSVDPTYAPNGIVLDSEPATGVIFKRMPDSMYVDRGDFIDSCRGITVALPRGSDTQEIKNWLAELERSTTRFDHFPTCPVKLTPFSSDKWRPHTLMRNLVNAVTSTVSLLAFQSWDSWDRETESFQRAWSVLKDIRRAYSSGSLPNEPSFDFVIPCRRIPIWTVDFKAMDSIDKTHPQQDDLMNHILNGEGGQIDKIRQDINKVQPDHNRAFAETAQMLAQVIPTSVDLAYAQRII